MLQTKFHLAYKSNDAALAKYKDPGYNEKRLWTAKLLAWYLYKNSLIIAIDESNFKSKPSHKLKWQFKPMLTKRSISKLINAPLVE